MSIKRTPAKKKAQELAKYLRAERPDYNYLRALFQNLRVILDVEVEKKAKTLPYVPTEEELSKFYKCVWTSDSKNKMNHLMLIKTLMYTGLRVSELISVKIKDVDLTDCQIRVQQGKGSKDRMVPFPASFKESLALHISIGKKEGAKSLFESSWKKPYSDRGIRKILEKYTLLAGIENSISPHKLRHFLFTWLKKKGIDDALIQPYSGHESRQSLEVYSKLSLADAQEKYDDVIDDFPV
jgi:integrase/recombinase XerD